MKTRSVKFTFKMLPKWNGMPFALFGIAVFLAGVYIHGINQVVVDALFLERADDRVARMEEDIRELEGNLAQISVGYRLEKEAQQLGLTGEGPVYFLEKHNTVAHSGEKKLPR